MTSPPRAPHHKVGGAPVQPAPTVTGPLPDVSIEHSPLTLELAVPPGYLIDARLLVISADGSEFGAGRDRADARLPGHAVRRVHRQPAVDAVDGRSRPCRARHGKYNGIILTRGTLPLSNGTSAFTTAEFQTLTSYEATFQVRRASLYTSPDAGYGYSGSVSQDTSSTPLATQCTATGRVGLQLHQLHERRVASAAPSRTVRPPRMHRPFPLLTDSSGRILAATRVYRDGREALSLNFAQSPSLFHTLQLFHGVVTWTTKGLFLGERHAYIGVQVDDHFLASDIYTGRHLPHHRDRFPGRERLGRRQAHPGRHRRDALPHRVQRRAAPAPATR